MSTTNNSKTFLMIVLYQPRHQLVTWYTRYQTLDLFNDKIVY